MIIDRRNAYKKLNGVANLTLTIMIFVVALAITASLIGWKYPDCINAMDPFVNFMDRLFNTKRMASESSFIQVAAIYYSITITIFPCSLIYFLIVLYFPPKWNLGMRYGEFQRLMAIPVAIFLIIFSVLVIYGMKGQDLRYIQLGSSLVQMLFLGWGVFVFCGFLISFSLIVIWKAISGQ